MACHSLLGSSTKKGHDDAIYVKIDFGENEDKLTACGILDNKEIPYLTSIKGKGKDSSVPPSDHPDKSNELVVKDIPLEIKKDDVKRKFSYYGKIEKIVLKVKLVGKLHTYIMNLPTPSLTIFRTSGLPH